ncbi:MAG TPA: tartrate-resistant acid phosphatase type 5 family protein [Candidatus Acidoferrales bacterium]|jgi:tartrate-resistant acid phosphatase type 5|nr:tartrate-resistant acid phosphatase type 5 family protein [Candidatus Acidoferrales bacterium]
MKQTRRDFVRTLFVASQAAVASRFLPANLFASGVPSSTLNFLVLGDWGRRGELDQKEVAEQMGIAAQNISARFVIAVGDNFYENGVASLTDPHWQESFEAVYTAPSLRIPWHVILGNHDYHGNCDAQLAYALRSPRWTMPARYYMQSHQIDHQTRADFFYVDTTPMVKIYYRHEFEERIRANVITQDVPGQLAWFKAALAGSKAQWKVVFGHHPIYSGGEHGDQPELIQSILPLLREHNVHAYFNGHDHDLQHLVAGDVNLFCTGAGSQVRPTKKIEYTRFAKSQSGFTTVSLGPDKMDVAMIDWQGTALYTTTVARSAAAVPA